MFLKNTKISLQAPIKAHADWRGRYQHKSYKTFRGWLNNI